MLILWRFIFAPDDALCEFESLINIGQLLHLFLMLATGADVWAGPTTQVNPEPSRTEDLTVPRATHAFGELLSNLFQDIVLPPCL